MIEDLVSLAADSWLEEESNSLFLRHLEVTFGVMFMEVLKLVAVNRKFESASQVGRTSLA